MTPKPWLYGVQQSYSRLRNLAEDGFHPLLVRDSDVDHDAV